MSSRPQPRQLLVAGVGFRHVSQSTSAGNIFRTDSTKPNIGASVALAAAQTGYEVLMVSRSAKKLTVVRDSILDLVPGATVNFSPTDLLDYEATQLLPSRLSNDRPVDIVHSAGLGAGDLKIQDENPYLPLSEIPESLPRMEFASVVSSLLNIVKAFLPIQTRLRPSRLVIVSSMTGVRGYPLGFSHSSAKGALHLAARSLTLELAPQGIEVSEVLPGMVDTGAYDPPSVDSAIRTISKSFGYSYRGRPLPLMPTRAIADAVILCLTSLGHVLSISVVSRGQIPHSGA